jgi:hypothetical protein
VLPALAPPIRVGFGGEVVESAGHLEGVAARAGLIQRWRAYRSLYAGWPGCTGPMR